MNPTIDVWTDENYYNFVREKNNRVLIADAVLSREKKEFAWLWAFLADAYNVIPHYEQDSDEWAKLRRKAWEPKNRQYLLAWVKRLDAHYEIWQKFHADYPKLPPRWNKVFAFEIKCLVSE